MKRLTSLLAIAVTPVLGVPDAGPLKQPHRALRGAAFFRRRMPIAHGIWLVALTVGLLTSSHRVLADDDQPPVIHLTGSDENLADLVVLCPQGAEPRFKNQKTGEMFPISDPRLRAIAKKACQSSLGLAEGSSNVNIVNTTGGPIWVGFFPKRVLRLIGVRVAQPSLPRQSKFRTEPAKLPWCSTLMPIPVRGSVP